MCAHDIISDAVATQSLESVATEKLKSFNKEEHWNLSNQEIVEIHKDQHLKDTVEEDFLKSSSTCQVFKENSAIFTKQNSNNNDMHDTIENIESVSKQIVDWNKRNVVNVEERLFLEILGEKNMFLHQNLEGRDDFVLRGILINFKERLNSEQEKLKAMKVNPALSHTNSCNSINTEIDNHEANRNNE